MGSSGVRMTIEWSVPIGQTRPITMALHTVAADTRLTRGCVSCSVSTDIASHGVVRYLEEWQTEDDLRRRVTSETFAPILTLLEDATQPPHIEFALPTGTQGFEFVEKARKARTHH